MAEKNVIVLKDLLSRAVKATEGFDSVDARETSTAKPIASTTNQYTDIGTKHLRQEEAFK